jgi:hypothetical protein
MEGGAPMVSWSSRLAGVAAAVALGAGLLLMNPAVLLAKAAGSPLTCDGGSIAPGTYSSVMVAGMCTVDSGSVTVTGNLVVAPGAALIAAFGGSDVTVHGNLIVGSNSVLVLGCEPFAFTCFNDPDQVNGGTLSAAGKVGGNLTADHALAVLVHDSRVGRNVVVDGGGGGVNCDVVLLGVSPAYATFEDVSVGGNVSISGWRSCWLGIFRSTVAGNVNFNDNVVADPDGNEVATDTVGGNLNCSGNDPAPQVGDSGGAPNAVGRKATGQCVSLTG